MKKSTFSKQHKERLLQVHRRKAFTDDLVSLPGLMQQCKLTVKNMPTEKTFCNTDSILMLVCMQIRVEKQYPIVRKTSLWNRVWTENVHKHINSLKTSRNLQLKVLEQEERTTVDRPTLNILQLDRHSLLVLSSVPKLSQTSQY